MGGLERVLRQRFVVIGAGRFGIERETELLIPVEGEAGAAEGVVMPGPAEASGAPVSVAYAVADAALVG